MVEWAWFINSYGADGVYTQLMNGDKDSFLLAFVLANKASEYYQVFPLCSRTSRDAPSYDQRHQVTNMLYSACTSNPQCLWQWRSAVSRLLASCKMGKLADQLLHAKWGQYVDQRL